MKNSENNGSIRGKMSDTLHKQLLRMRPVVASAIKIGCIEFRKNSRQDIEKKISTAELLPALDPTVGSLAAGENCEVCDDGTKTVFDSLFVVKHGRTAVRVNIEAQTTRPKSLPQRQNYYIARGLSSEKSHGVFKGSEYHKLQKFYSIWLMSDPEESMEGLIEFDYRTKASCRYPNQDLSVLADDRESSPYCIATVYLPKGDLTATDADPMNILAVMMRNPAGIKEKEQFLQNNGIVIDDETKGAIDTMCTLEEHFINKGREEGRQLGREEGREEGIQLGLEKGQQESLIKVARNMLAQGITLEIVRTCTGLTLQKLQELAKSLTQHSISKHVRAVA